VCFIAQRSKRGASLVEVLVVMVILALGIFAVVRLFPSGFIALEHTKEQAMAAQLARQTLERLKGQRESLPLAIYPVTYRFVGSNLVLEVDPTTHPDDLGFGENIDTSLIDPTYTSDVNRIRRIIGETVRLPAPKPVAQDATDPRFFGSLYQLQFAPMLYDARVFVPYGSDLQLREISRDSASDAICLNRDLMSGQRCYVDPDIGALWVPVSASRTIRYRVNVSFWATVGGVFVRHDFVDLIVPADPSLLVESSDCWPPNRLNAIQGIDLVPMLEGPGEQFHSLIASSVRVARIFDEIGVDEPFTPGYPYEYKILNDKLGLVLFNPAGYDYRERRARRLIPLRANLDYDVLDWHIICDERRVGYVLPYRVKLTLESIKRHGQLNHDQTRFLGLTYRLDNDERDMFIIDVADGAEVVNTDDYTSYTVDSLKGIVTLAEPVYVVQPGASGPVERSPAGRTFRFLYMAHDDWAMQVQKAPYRYQIVQNVYGPGDLGVSQAYIGGSGPQQAGDPSRIYFPPCDVGKNVLIREYRYVGGNASRVARSEDFIINPPRPGDPLQLPYIDIASDGHHPDAVGFDWDQSAAPVQGVMGTSVKVRVIWSPTHRERSAAERQQSYPDLRYLPVWKKVDFDTHLTKEVAD
jgi:type II secretory pathway pseudopilin PulG